MTDPAKPSADAEDVDFNLLSLVDLEREHAAGDLDDDAYERLRNEYTHRAAAGLHRANDDGDAPAAEPEETPARPLWQRYGWWALLVAVVAGVGVMFAANSGSRGAGGNLIAGQSVDDRLAACAALGPMSPKSGDCYEELLRQYPKQPQALTYTGWAEVRGGKIDAGVAKLRAAVSADPTYPDPHVFLAVAASRQKNWVEADKELDTVHRLDPPPVLVTTLQSMGLERKVAEARLSAPLATCWNQTKALMGATESTTKQPTVTGTLQCYGDRIAALRPQVAAGNADAIRETTLARTLLGWLTVQLDARLAASAVDQLDEALRLTPGDPTALMIRGFVYGSTQQWALARRDALDLNESGGRPSGLVTDVLGSPKELLAAINDGQKAATSTTVAAPTTTARTTTAR